MTRFMISLEQGVELVWHAFDDMEGGEIYVKKIPSMNICDIATAVNKDCEQVEIGIRPGEKLHEAIISQEDAFYTYEYPEHFKILPQICEWSTIEKMIKGGKRVPEGFSYTSDNNKEWMTIPQLQEWIEKNKAKVGNI